MTEQKKNKPEDKPKVKFCEKHGCPIHKTWWGGWLCPICDEERSEREEADAT